MRSVILSAALAASFVTASSAFGQVLTLTDGPTPSVFANGGGTGFGGTLGNGSISMDVVGSDLVIGFTPAGGLNDIVGLFLDTRSGGETDASMSDTGDGSRRVLSNLTRDLNDVFPISPDFGVTFGSFPNPSSVVFELTAAPAALNFISFNGAGAVATIPLATLGNPTQIDFFAAYGSDGGYMSNESLPRSPSLQGLGTPPGPVNPGFGDGQFGAVNPPPTQISYDNFNRFIVPEPATLGALAAAGLLVLRRRG